MFSDKKDQNSQSLLSADLEGGHNDHDDGS